MILCEIVCDLSHGLYVLSPTTKNARPNGRTINVKQALHKLVTLALFPAMCMSMTERNFLNLLTIRNGNLPYVIQNERYASSGISVLISFARVSIASVNSWFLQSQLQRKMAARFFLHGDHLAKVVLSGTPLLRPVQYDRTFLRPVQYDRTFLDSVQYGNLLYSYKY